MSCWSQMLTDNVKLMYWKREGAGPELHSTALQVLDMLKLLVSMHCNDVLKKRRCRSFTACTALRWTASPEYLKLLIPMTLGKKRRCRSWILWSLNIALVTCSPCCWVPVQVPSLNLDIFRLVSQSLIDLIDLLSRYLWIFWLNQKKIKIRIWW